MVQWRQSKCSNQRRAVFHSEDKWIFVENLRLLGLMLFILVLNGMMKRFNVVKAHMRLCLQGNTSLERVP
jgi:hypothetical protein